MSVKGDFHDIDGYLDGYHLGYLHRNSIGAKSITNRNTYDLFGPHVRVGFATKLTDSVIDVPEDEWHLADLLSVVHYVFPNTVLIYHPDYISHLGMFPDSADETLFVHTMLTPEAPADAKADAHWARSFELIDTGVFNREDLVVCEQIQRGLRSGANDSLILGRLEQNLLRFHSSVDAALR